MKKTVNTLSYETTPIHAMSRFAVLRLERNIDKLPTWEILRRLYVRHERILLETALVGTYLYLIVAKLF